MTFDSDKGVPQNEWVLALFPSYIFSQSVIYEQ